MTPEEARRLRATLDATGCLDDVLADALGTIADMRYEYAVELKHGDGWITSRHHTPTIETAKEIAARYKRTDTRIVRRLVSDPEVVE